MITGFVAVGLLLMCAFLSVPLGVVALITGFFGLSGLGDEPSSDRRKAVAGMCWGGGAILGLSLVVVLVGL